MAVAEDNLAGAENFKKKLGLGDDVKSYGNYDEFFKDNDVGEQFPSFCIQLLEVVYVGIVNFLHYKMVMASLDAGKHVLCEKPLGMNVREVKGVLFLSLSNRSL